MPPRSVILGGDPENPTSHFLVGGVEEVEGEQLEAHGPPSLHERVELGETGDADRAVVDVVTAPALHEFRVVRAVVVVHAVGVSEERALVAVVSELGGVLCVCHCFSAWGVSVLYHGRVRFACCCGRP